MHYYTRAGESIQNIADRFTDLPKLRDGYCWHDRAPLGAGFCDWHEVVAPHDASGKLFGYDAKAFMARQYK